MSAPIKLTSHGSSRAESAAMPFSLYWGSFFFFDSNRVWRASKQELQQTKLGFITGSDSSTEHNRSCIEPRDLSFRDSAGEHADNIRYWRTRLKLRYDRAESV